MGGVEMVEDLEAGQEWLSSKQAARKLGITIRTLYRLIDGGELPAYKVGRVIRLRDAEVDAFIEQARIPPGSLRHLYPDTGGDDLDLAEQETD